MIYLNEKKKVLATKANHRYEIEHIFYCIHLIFMFLVFLGQVMMCCIEMIQIYHVLAPVGNSEGFGG